MGQLPFEKKKRSVLVRKEYETSDKFGVHPEDRPVEQMLEYGIVNLDKPAGPTSHQVSAYVKQILGIKKAGHSGTLDPMVTGVLPVGLGRGTRVVHSLLTAGKEYVCLMHLHGDLDEGIVLEGIKKFEGKIDQLPPVRSAVKRKLRKRNVYYIDVLEVRGRDMLFKTGTQAGTYIRKLCHDIGEELDVGAHMAELRRTKAGPFKEDSLVNLQDLADAFHYWKEGDDSYLKELIMPVEKGVEHLGKVWVMDTTVDSLCHGASLKFPGICKVESGILPKDLVAVMTLKGELIITGTAVGSSKEMRKKSRGVAVKPKQVFMNPGVYPKLD